MNDLNILRHVWLMLVITTVANAFVLKARSGAQIRKHPELAVGYRRYFRGILLWVNLPWLLMGFEIELGGVPNIFSYFRPADGNPLVLAWLGFMVAYWLLGFYWLFARRGAEFIVEHPGLLNQEIKSPATVRFLYCLLLAEGLGSLVIYSIADIPLPK